MPDLSSYNLRLTDVRTQLDQLPANVRDAVWRVICSFGDLEQRHPERVRREANGRVYRHPSPAFELFFQVDDGEMQVNVSQVVELAFTPRIMVFISYCHANMDRFNEFLPFLKVLTKRNQLWHDHDLRAGDDFEDRIRHYIAEAKFAVLMVTQQFLASDFISEIELPLILERHRQGAQEIHWIPCGHAVFDDDSPFKRIHAAFNPKTPLYELTKPQREKAYVKIAQALLEKVKEATDATA